MSIDNAVDTEAGDSFGEGQGASNSSSTRLMNKLQPSLRVKEKVMVMQKRHEVRMQKVKVKVRAARLPLVKTNLHHPAQTWFITAANRSAIQLMKMNLNHHHDFLKT